MVGRDPPFTKKENRLLLLISSPGCLERASEALAERRFRGKERETRFELATACLEGRNSTTELLPHALTQK